MTTNTHPQNPHSPAAKTDTDASKDIVFYDGMSEEELDLLLQASLTEDNEKAAKAAAKSVADSAEVNTDADADAIKVEPTKTPAVKPVVSTAVSNTKVPRPNTPTKYYSALSPSVADRTVFRSDSHQVQTAQERAAMKAAEVPKPARSQIVIDDTVVELADEFKNFTPAKPTAEASQAAPAPQQSAATPRKSLKALTAAHSTSVKIHPKAAPAPVNAQIAKPETEVNQKVAEVDKKVTDVTQKVPQAKPVERPVAETPQVKKTPTTATDTAIPKKVSAIKIKPKAAVDQPKTIAAGSDSEVIVEQKPTVAPVTPLVVATEEETLSTPPVTPSLDSPAANVETTSAVEPAVAETIPSEPVKLEEPAEVEPVKSETIAAETIELEPVKSEAVTSKLMPVSTEAATASSTPDSPSIETAAIETSTESKTTEEVTTSATPDTKQLSEQVSADMHLLKTHLHQLTLQFHELGSLSSRLMQQLRHLQSNSTDDFSVTYEQMLELRSHLVGTKKQASDLPSLLDVAEEALESEMYVAQTRKKR